MIYFLIQGNEIVYVGQTISPFFSRIAGHMNKLFDSFVFISAENEMLNDLEAYYIVKFKPKYNVALPGSSFYTPEGKLAKELGITVGMFRALMHQLEIKPVFGKSYCRKEFAKNKKKTLGLIKIGNLDIVPKSSENGVWDEPTQPLRKNRRDFFKTHPAK